jgi:hypothetical protein
LARSARRGRSLAGQGGDGDARIDALVDATAVDEALARGGDRRRRPRVARIGAGSITYTTGTIQGTLLTSAGQPFPSGSIRAISLDGNGSLSTTPDANGNFVLTFVPTGNYQLDAYYEMYDLGTQPVTVTAGQTATAAFTLLAGTVQVTVEQDGSPAAGAEVQLVEQAPYTCSSPGCMPPDANGNCTCFEPGVPGPIFCSATGAGGVSSSSSSSSGSSSGCGGSSSSGSSSSSSGGTGSSSSSSGGGVTCVYEYPGSSFGASTDATGTASLFVPALPFRVSVTSANAPGQFGGIVVGETSVTVADQQTLSLGAFPYCTGTVSGTVTEGGSPIANASVQAQSSSSTGSVTTNVDASGNYSLTLPLGGYSIAASIFGGTPFGGQSITVAPGTQTVDFAQPGGFITGRVAADGAPAPNAFVQIATLAPYTCASPGCMPPDANGNCTCFEPGVPGPIFCSGNSCVVEAPGSTYGTSTNASGTYSIFVPPGNYLVTVSSAQVPGQYGAIRVGVPEAATITDGIVADLGPTSYQTGFVTGQVTSCGQPLTNVSITVQPLAGSGSVGTTVDSNGQYSMQVPIGAYSVGGRWQMVPLASNDISVAPGQTTPALFAEDLGQLRGLVLRDGQPSTSSPVQIVQQAVGVTCTSPGCMPPDTNGNCTCFEAGVPGPIFCTAAAGCVIESPGSSFGANTGADGFFTVSVPPASYVVTAYSSQTGGQFGSVAVGSFDVTAVACQLVEVGTSGASTSGGTNVTVPLGDGVQLTFPTVSAGNVGYTATSTPQGAPPPDNLEFAGLFYDITTDASYTGPVQICLPYDVDVTDPTQLEILHNVSTGVGGSGVGDSGAGDAGSTTWVNITTSVDTVNHVVCGSTPSFSWFVVGVLKTKPPTASAGAPFTVAADGTCHATVTLDGSGSTAGSSSIASYQWFNQGMLLGTGETLTTTLGLGVSVITLTVTDVDGGTSSASVQVTVADQTPPSLSVAESPSTLWPPSGNMVVLTPSFTVSDNCDPSPAVALVGVTCPTAAPGDIQISASQQVSVRAFRNGSETSGRVYTETYRATDRSGNASTASATVTVPHDQGKH